MRCAAFGGDVVKEMVCTADIHHTCAIKCQVNAHGRLWDIGSKTEVGRCLLGASNFHA